MSFKYFAIRKINSSIFLSKLYYSSIKRYKRLLVSAETDLVIEGFPRCANSFSIIAFESVQKKNLNIAHHLHSVSQLKAGIKYKIPVLILIREPLGAISSLLTRDPKISVSQAIEEYIEFYGYVCRKMNSVVIADFKLITSNYCMVIEALNHRFSKNYDQYINDKANDELVFAEIDRLNADNEAGDIGQLARPSVEKKILNNVHKERVRNERLFASAQDVYSQIVSSSSYIK